MMIADTLAQHSELFRKDFVALCNGRQPPCMYHWFFGNCTRRGCTLAHELATQTLPSTAIVNGMKQRFKAQCDYLMANPKA